MIRELMPSAGANACHHLARGQATFKKRSLRLLVGTVLIGGLPLATSAIAQDFDDLKTYKAPLVLKGRGTFFVGGEIITTDGLVGANSPFPAPYSGKMAVNQMYVEYMVPAGDVKVPVVMLHGGTLTGKSYGTTPDGRMGWDEHFVRKGHAVYVPDQVGRGRSGFNQSQINIVATGNAPPSTLPNILRIDTDFMWTNFRFGAQPGIPYPGVQFPVTAADEFAKQAVPDFLGLPTSQFTVKAMSDLAVKLKGAVLMGHSQSGSVPLRAALLSPTAVKATIVVDGCPDGNGGSAITDAQLSALKKVPMVGVIAERKDPATCKAFVDRFTALGGKAQVIYLPDLGIRGNDHMIMLDKNNQQIADLIIKWLDKNVKAKKSHGHDDDDDDDHRH